MAKNTAPYGSWVSPVKAELLATAGIGIGDAAPYAGGICWLERRPLESGRNVLVVRSANCTTCDLTPAGFNVRTTVHEYGGGSFVSFGSTMYFSNFTDQRLYRQIDGGEPEPVTPEPSKPWGWRYADMQVTPDGSKIVCVREIHSEDGQVDNELAVLTADGSAPVVTIASGYDFYANPRISPDGKQLAWICWNNPNMPWDGTELWLADLAADGTLANARMLAGGLTESVTYPTWGPGGELVASSDRTNWWNLYRLHDGKIEQLVDMPAEFSGPAWVFGLSFFTFLPDGRIACIVNQDGFDSLALLTPGKAELEPLLLDYTVLGSLHYHDGKLLMVAGSAEKPSAVILFDLETRQVEVVKQSMTVDITAAYFSIPEPIAFPTENGQTAYALYYPPVNPDYEAPAGEKPPLLVCSHGGPTGQTNASFSYSMQYWTSRGIGVVDVNYGGSTGYGREYRERLKDNWGIVDVNDCVNAAKYLVARGLADVNRVAVRGGSAGGYTTLRALTWTDFFKAGASYFGVSDLEGLVKDTHKFEAQYLFGLVGPYPERKDIYDERSPVKAVDNISCPVILFQGAEDRVVPPSQAEVIVHALIRNETPYAYLLFEGEQHGFRKAETITRAASAELYFYGKVFGFEPADEIETVEIHNME